MSSIKDKDKVELYRQLVLNRIFEEKTIEVYRKEGIPELPHSNFGQEAIGVGACYGLNDDDYVLPSLRTRPALITKGVPLNVMMADMYGKIGGTTQGRATSHHLGYPSKGVVGTTGIIGGHLTISTGVGLACRYKKNKRVVLCFFGDGGCNRGDFHTSLNFASLKKLPVLYIIENNQFAEGMPLDTHMTVKDISIRAKGYNMPGVIVNGNDVLEVYTKVQEAVKRAREGKGPTLLECKTYRVRPHTEAGVESRPKEVIDKAMEDDPVPKLKKHLLDEGIQTEKQLDEMHAECKKMVDDSFQFGKDAPYPKDEELYINVYAEKEEWVKP